jgi:hypothetical protein
MSYTDANPHKYAIPAYCGLTACLRREDERMNKNNEGRLIDIGWVLLLIFTAIMAFMTGP